MGHNHRNVYNPPGENGKAKRDLFLVELEPAENNKDVYSIRVIDYQVVTIKPPRQRVLSGDSNVNHLTIR